MEVSTVNVSEIEIIMPTVIKFLVNSHKNGGPSKEYIILDDVEAKVLRLKLNMKNIFDPIQIHFIKFFKTRDVKAEKRKWKKFKIEANEFLENLDFKSWDFSSGTPKSNRGSFLVEALEQAFNRKLNDEEIECFTYCVKKAYKKISRETPIEIPDEDDNDDVIEVKTETKTEPFEDLPTGSSQPCSSTAPSMTPRKRRQSDEQMYDSPKKIKKEYEFPNFDEDPGAECVNCRKLFNRDYLEEHYDHCGIIGLTSEEKQEAARRDLANRLYRQRRRLQTGVKLGRSGVTGIRNESSVS